MATQTTVTCGLPSLFSVVRWASGPVATRVRTDPGRVMAIEGTWDSVEILSARKSRRDYELVHRDDHLHVGSHVLVDRIPCRLWAGRQQAPARSHDRLEKALSLLCCPWSN